MSEMAAWDKEYSEHPVWANLEEAIDLFKEVVPSDDQEQYQINLAILRLTSVLERRHTASLFVTIQMLSRLRDAVLDSVIAQLNNHTNNPTAGYVYVSNAISGVQDVMEFSRGWPPSKDVFGKGILAALVQAGDTENERQQQLLNDLEDAQSRLDAQQKEFLDQFNTRDSVLKERLEEIRDESNTTLTTIKEMSNAELQGLTTEVESTQKLVVSLEANATRQSERLDQALNSVTESFRVAEEKRDTTFQSTLKSARAEQTREVTKLRNELKSLTVTQQAEGDALLASFTERRNEIGRLLEAVAGDVTSTEYGAHARNLKRQADWMFWLAIGLFVVAASVIGVLYWYNDGLSKDATRTLMIKATLSLPLIVAGWALLRQSKEIREESSLAKDMQLKLVAFEPFIANIENIDARLQMRKDVVNALFVEGKGGLKSLGEKASK